MLPGIPPQYYYPLFALLMLVVVFVFVPKEKFGSLFWVSLIWGYVGTFLFNGIVGAGLDWFDWRFSGGFQVLGVSHWLALAWLLAMMLFLRFLPTRKAIYAFPGYLVAFAWASGMLDLQFHQLGLLVYHHWNPFYRFLLGLIWFYGAARHQWALERLPHQNGKEEI
jgi:hypothetical protein